MQYRRLVYLAQPAKWQLIVLANGSNEYLLAES